MKCSRVRDKLMAYAAGELSPREAEDVGAHLDGCDSCRAQYDIAGRASAALNCLREEEAAPELIGAVRRKLAVAPRRLRLAPLAAALCVPILVALIAACWMWQKPAPVIRQETYARREPTRIVSNPVTHQPKAVSIATTGTVRHRTPHHKRPSARTERDRPVVAIPTPVPETVEPPEVSPEHPPTPSDGKSQIVIALRPREPEILLYRTGGENGSPSTNLTVVREFDVSGNVVSVSITGNGRMP